MGKAVVGAVISLILFGLPTVGSAQARDPARQYGMFGPRDLGGSLKPGETRYLRDLRIPRSTAFGATRSRFPQTPGSNIPAPIAPRSLLRELPYVPAGIPPVGSQVYVDSAGVPVAVPVVPPVDAAILTPELPPEAAAESTSPENESAAPFGPPSDAAVLEPVPLQGTSLEETIEQQTYAPLPQPRPAQPELRAGFSYGRPSPARLAARLSQQLSASPRIEKLSPIRVQIQGATAILHGAVASTYDRRVAEQVLRLEPGIVDVQNNLTVQPSR